MKLHLPKGLLAALIGAVLAGNITPAMAGVLTTGSFTYTAGGTDYTFSGTAAIESNYDTDKNIGTSSTDFIVGSTTYNGAANTADGPFIADSSVEAGHGANNFWKNLTDRSDSGFEGAVYGQTLLMKGSTTATQQLKNNGMGNMAIGGLITEDTAATTESPDDTSNYILNGASGNSNLTLVANESVGMNMYIGANTEIKVGGTGQLIAATNGTWNLNSGKTLTMTAGADGAVVFQSAISVQGGGTLSISDGLTFDGGSITVASGSTLHMTGTVDIISHASGAETARDRANGNGFGHAEYSVNTSDYIRGDGTANLSEVSWSINGKDASLSGNTLSYTGDNNTYYIYNAGEAADYSSATHLVVDVEMGNTYDLGTSTNTTLESMTIKSGKVTSSYAGGPNSGVCFMRGDIFIEAGAELELTGAHDALGWDNHPTRSISLRGEAHQTANLTLSYTDDASTTLKTNLNLQGYALVSGGALNAFGGTITVTGTDNIFASTLELRNALTVDVVGSSDSLLINGNIVSNGYAAFTGALTKTGAGLLEITGDINGGNKHTINGANTTIIHSASIQNVTIENARLAAEAGQNLSGTVNLTNVTLAGTMNITGGTTTYTAGTLRFEGDAATVTISQGATLAHDGFNFTANGTEAATIQGSGQDSLLLYTGSNHISNATLTKTADGDKYIGVALDNVDLTLNNGADNRLYGSHRQSLRNLTVNGGTLNVESAATVSGTTTVADGAKVTIKNTGASLGSVTGAGTVESEQNATVNTASGFTGTLAAKGNSVLTDAGTGSGFDVDATAGDLVLLNRDTAITLDSVALAGGHSLTIGTETSHDITLNLTTLTVGEGGGTLNANLNLTGTETLDMSSALTLGCSVDLGDGGVALSGSLLDGLATNGYVELFTGVDELMHNGAAYSEPISASEVFSNDALRDTADVNYTVAYENNVVMLKSSVIPEPTTATLSLLALMGLAARRRRK